MENIEDFFPWKIYENIKDFFPLKILRISSHPLTSQSGQ